VWGTVWGTQVEMLLDSFLEKSGQDLGAYAQHALAHLGLLSIIIGLHNIEIRKR
jgi:hypothetical protein